MNQNHRDRPTVGGVRSGVRRMARAKVCIGILLCMLNASICQAELQDRLACLVGESHDPCDFERACDLRACELTHEGVQLAEPAPRPSPDRFALPLPLLVEPLVPRPGAGGPRLLDDPSKPPGGGLLRSLALLQRFLC
jgi:hypothetical protein